MMLFAWLQNLDFPLGNRNPIIPIRDGYPSFSADLNKKLIKTNRVLVQERVRDFMDSRRQDNILSRTLKTHDAALIDPYDHQIAYRWFDYIVRILFVERVYSVQLKKVTQDVVTRAEKLIRKYP